MPPKAWQPPLTGDLILDRCFSELSGRLSDMSVQIDDLDAPQTRVVSVKTTLVDERFVEWRGGAGEVILPDARYRGSARAGMVTIQNTGIGALTVRAAPRNTINGLASFPVPMASAVIFTGNGVDKWSAAGASGGGGGGAGSQIWDPDKFYMAVNSWSIHPLSTVPYAGISSSQAQDIIYAQQVTFSRAGTITTLSAMTGGFSVKIWVGLYDADPSNEAIPVNLLYSAELIPPAFSFNTPVNATGVGVDVAAGQTIWFAHLYNFATTCLYTDTSAIAQHLGTTYDGVATGAIAPAFKCGYAHAFTYAALPSVFPGSGSPTPILTTTGQMPVIMYKFTPTV